MRLAVSEIEIGWVNNPDIFKGGIDRRGARERGEEGKGTRTGDLWGIKGICGEMRERGREGTQRRGGKSWYLAYVMSCSACSPG